MPKISVSIGIAEHQRHEEIQQFIHRADITMYEAKGVPGNIVAISPERQELPINQAFNNL